MKQKMNRDSEILLLVLIIVQMGNVVQVQGQNGFSNTVFQIRQIYWWVKGLNRPDIE